MYKFNFKLFLTLTFAISLNANIIDLDDFDLPNETKNEIIERVDSYDKNELIERKSFLLASLDNGGSIDDPVMLFQSLLMKMKLDLKFQ